jgi:tRNA threonylcarbamoyladenosine biosynthesis protein TsaB
MSEDDLILGIESAVAGGSLSLYRAEAELGTWTGEDEPLRAEDVLLRIHDLLDEAGVKKTELTRIAVSAGPGSFTGIRVGIATALGLKKALQVELSSFSVLEAMAAERDLTGVAVIPMGRGAACAQQFSKGSASGEPFNIAIDDLRHLDIDGIFLVHAGLSQLAARRVHVEVFGHALAMALVRISAKRPTAFAQPIFISRTAKP